MKRVLYVAYIVWLLSGIALEAQGGSLVHENDHSAAIQVYTKFEKWIISPHLLGLHVEYAWEKDSYYENAKLIDWMKRCRVSNIRYPGGGTTKYWNWKNPTGHFNIDRNDPKWEGEEAPESEWMSLDEYFDLLKKIGGIPHLGINHMGPYQYDAVEQGIRDAVDLVKYTNDKGYYGAFFYIGNEDLHIYKGAADAGNMIRTYALAMKEVDPHIKVLFNQNKLTESYLQEFLKAAGAAVDICEFHLKWPRAAALKWDSGGDPKPVKTFDDWLKDNPVREKRWNHPDQFGVVKDCADKYRIYASSIGRVDVLMADTEWGMNARRVERFNPFQYAMIGADMLQAHFIGNYYMANYWNTTFHSADERAIINMNGEFTPLSNVFELLAPALEATMIQMDIPYDDMPSFACIDKQHKKLYLYLLNKSRDSRSIQIQLDRTGGGAEIQSLVDNEDHSGTVVNAVAGITGRELKVSLPSLSYSRVAIELEN